MGSINDYSDKQFIELIKELNRQDTYPEKVKFFYDKTERFKGERRTIKNKEYSFSLLPQTKEEKLIWWEYFVERRALEYSKVWMDKNASGVNKAEDRTRTLGVLLNDIQNEVKGNDGLKRGYEYGIKKTGFDSINLESFDVNSFMSEIGKGLGLYYAELELKKLQEESKEEKSVLDIKIEYTDGYRLVLLEQLGIIEHLMTKYKIPNNQPILLTKLLGEIMGVDIASPKNKKFRPYVKNILSNNEKKGPKNPTSTKEVNAFLTKLGIH